MGWQISWSKLSEEDRELLRAAGIINGCGGKGHWLDPPDWIFTASCDHHDFEYWRGGSEVHRAKSDWDFYQAMLDDVQDLYSWWHPKRHWGRLHAWAYYRAVRRFGGRPESWNSERIRGRGDLEKALQEGREALTRKAA